MKLVLYGQIFNINFILDLEIILHALYMCGTMCLIDSTFF